jgi:hypothetical protein
MELRPLPLRNDEPMRELRSYYTGIGTDDVWQENFAFGDVPAGQYELIIDLFDGVHRYRRERANRAIHPELRHQQGKLPCSQF